MKRLCSFVFLFFLVRLISAQSPITIPFPEEQFYEVPVSREVIDNELDSILQYNYNSSTKKWNKVYRYNFHYDTTGLMVNAIKWNWRWDELYWKGETKKEFHYTDNKLTNSIEYMWVKDSSNWVKNYINYYNYTNDGIVETQFYNYIATAKQVQYMKRMLYYNQNWYLTLERIFDFIAFDQTFDESQRITYKYDSKNRLIEYIDYSNYFYWEVHSKDLFNYNDDSSSMVNIAYNSQNGVLTECGRFLSKFIYENDQLKRIIRNSDSYDFKYMDSKLTERISYMGTDTYNEKIECFYSKKTVPNAVRINKKDIQNNFLQPEGLKRLELFNMNGLLLLSMNDPSDWKQLNLNDLTFPKGLYLLRITKEDGKSYSRKIWRK